MGWIGLGPGAGFDEALDKMIERLSRLLAAVAVGAALVPMAALAPAAADPIPGDTWVTDGDVDAMVIANGKVYIGGSFTQVGPNTGGGADVSATTGQFNPVFDRVDGLVNAVVSDGAGGWYIGGDFSFVDGLSRPRAAHLGADGAVTAWRPNVSDGSVDALYRVGNTLYLGGSFTQVMNSTRNRLAAVDISSENASLLPWNPNANGVVKALVADGGDLVVGGDFTSVGGAGRDRLAKIDAGSGAVDGWDPGANGSVHALALDGTTLYVAGDFTSTGGSARSSLAAIDIASGVATSWNPGSDGTVHAVAVAAGTVYAGGNFTSVAGSPRSHLAAIDAVSGSTTGWDPAPDGPVRALVVEAGDVFVGGDFTSIAAAARNRMARITSAGGVTGFDPSANGPVNAVAVAGARAYIGGSFGSVNGAARSNLAALDAATGVLDPTWAPAANDSVLALESSSDGSVIFVGGAFTTINGGDHRRIAAVDAASGAIDGTFFAQANNRVHALHADAGTLYIGGDFGTVSSTSRKRLAAMNEITGDLNTSFAPVIDDSVRDIATSPDGSLVYVGGLFDDIDGIARDEIAALDAATGTVDPVWNPNTNRRVYEFEVTDDAVLVAMGGGGGRVYSFHPTSGVTNWFIHTDGDVQTLATRGDHVYVGGHFLNVGADSRQFFFAADLATGSLEPTWAPRGKGGLGPFTLEETNGRLWTGGEFTEIESRSANRLAYLDAIVFTPPGSYRDRVIGDGADVYWRLGETAGTTAVDEVGTVDGTYNGGVTLGAGALIADANTAADFDGSSGWIAVPDSNLINIGGPFEQRSIEIWFEADSTIPRQVLFEEGGSTRGLNMYIEAGSLHFGAWNTSDNGDGTTPWPAPVFFSSPIVAGETYHAVLAFDYSQAMRGYVNGDLVGEDTAVGRLYAHGNNVAIGGVAGSTRYPNGTSTLPNYFDGTIDEVALYNTTLSEAKAAAHYLLGTLTGAAPQALVVSPDAGAAVSGVVTVSTAAEDAADDPGTLTVEISIDGGGSWNPAAYQAGSGTYDLIWDTTAGPDGTTDLLARATDSDANQATSSPVAVTVANTNAAPSVAITAPPQGAAVGGTVPVEVDATDLEDPAGSLDVSVRVDGGPWQPADWQAGLNRYTYDWDTSGLPEGPADLEARAIDSQLVATVSATVTVTVAGPDPYPALVAADGAATHWRLGEASGVTAADELGGVDGTYAGGPTLGSGGLIAGDDDSAARFDGSDDTVDLPDDELTNTGGPYEAKTVELWFNADDTGGRGVLYEQGGSSRGISLYVQDGLVYGGFWNVTNNGDGTTPWPAPVFVSAPVEAGVDYHVVLTYDFSGDRVELFVDGLSRAVAGDVGRLFAHGSNGAIGAMRNHSRFHTGGASGAGFYFDGVIDEVATYNAAVTSGQVAAHYQLGAGTGSGPIVELLSPDEGATVSGVVTVAVAAADESDPAGSLDVEVRIDDGAWTTAGYNGSTGHYELPWDTTSTSNGPATIEARATDSTPITSNAPAVAVAVGNSTGYASEVLADGPAVYWRLDDVSGTTAIDEVGGLDGTYTNGVGLGAAGLVADGTAISLDGDDDYVAVANSTLINLGDPIERRSVELWFSAPDVTTRQVLYEEGGNGRGINIYVDGGNLYYAAWNRTDNGDGTTPWVGGEIFLSTPVGANTTYHVALTLDQPSDLLTAYLNGAAVASSSGIGRLYPHSANIGIGAMINQARFHDGGKSGDGFHLSGQLDEVAVYNAVLSPARVAAHHAAGT